MSAAREPAATLLEVQLSSEPRTGCGFTIVGSKSTGFAIKSLMSGGIAERDGRLQNGDRIISINDSYVTHLACDQVARFLRQTDPVTVCVIRPNYGSIYQSSYFYQRASESHYSEHMEVDMQGSELTELTDDEHTFHTSTHYYRNSSSRSLVVSASVLQQDENPHDWPQRRSTWQGGSILA